MGQIYFILLHFITISTMSSLNVFFSISDCPDKLYVYHDVSYPIIGILTFDELYPMDGLSLLEISIITIQMCFVYWLSWV